MSAPVGDLIPPPPLVRAELARAVREARRLRSLLRLAERAELDRRQCDEMAPVPMSPAPRHEADGPGVGR